MKISYNWLRQYIDISLPPQEVADLLTNCGLEVESVEKFETVKGGLEGCVIGEVKTKEKHPDADKLSVTTVDIGTGTLLNIVCGAANVAAGQKVVVATAGATIYPTNGEPLTLRKAKIRGAVSEGMICAEDELGLGTSHEGIMVLDPSAKAGTPAREYFKVDIDHVFEIGLTPNRGDAASHYGVARDLTAVINCKLQTASCKLALPSITSFNIDNKNLAIEVAVEDTTACPRYSGITLSGITVKESPGWLKNRLRSIGLKPINNIVDVTNFVLHELGQPLHAFDADKIKGKKVVVKKLPAGTKFKTLDDAERTLTANDLMICNANGGMCIAGVFGGIESGVTGNTKDIFLESAYFDPTHIRRTARHHGLKTDASFRFERGTDPNITVFALQRAAALIREIAGGKISSEIVDVYPKPIGNFKVPLSYSECDKLAGKKIDREKIKSILAALGIEIAEEGKDTLLLAVPPFKSDVTRQADVVEDILRIYGYNNVETPSRVRASLSYSPGPDEEAIRNAVSDMLSANGFAEIFSNSLTNSAYYPEEELSKAIRILNPNSTELDILRMSMLYSGLEAIAYNQNRQNSDLQLYEFGRTYHKTEKGHSESKHLALFLTGEKQKENWNVKSQPANFYSLKGAVEAVAEKLGIADIKYSEFTNSFLAEGLQYASGKNGFSVCGKVKKAILKKFDIKNDVFFAGFKWDVVMGLIKNNSIQYEEVPKFPEVRRDLALLIDKSVKYKQLEELAFQAERSLLKKVNLFDVYEGDKIESGKKSYALSFILQDENATLTDKQIDKVMEKLQKIFEEKAGAKIRAN